MGKKKKIVNRKNKKINNHLICIAITVLKMFKILIIIFLSLNFLFASDKQSISLGIHKINTDSREYVFDTRNNNYKKISELIWKTNNTKLLGLAYDYLAFNKIIFSVDAKTKTANGNSEMNDYDWLIDSNSNWSDWSYHKNTKLIKMKILDISIKKNIPKYFGIISQIFIGFKYDNKAFRAYDGTYVYSQNGFRNKVGSFNGLGISYEETLYTYYTGLGFYKKIKNFTFSTQVKYSLFGHATSIDNHHKRNFINNNTFYNINMKEFTIGVQYLIDRINKISFSLDYSKTKYDKSTGRTRRVYYEDNALDNVSAGDEFNFGGSGIKNDSQSISFTIIKKI